MNTFEWVIVVAGLIFLFSQSIYILFLILSAHRINKSFKMKVFNKFSTYLQWSPQVTLIVPAYNEEACIVDSVESILSINYTKFKIFVVNDGSKDKTFELIKCSFQLEEISLERKTNLSIEIPEGIFRSKVHKNLYVINKKNSGKADTLNMAIDYCDSELICCVDADSILDENALISVTLPFLENPDTIAVGGSVRVFNGSEMSNRRVSNIRIANDWLSVMQTVEYMRSFFCGRVGLSALNSTLIVSGAFGIFRAKAVKKVGGYKVGSMGEDMDIVFRLHKYHLDKEIPYSIIFLPDPICWTEAPRDLMSLRKQRIRWQVGLLEIVVAQWRMIGRWKYRALGMFGLPYLLFVDVLIPVLEIIMIFTLGLAFFYSHISSEIFTFFFFVSFFFSSFISLGSMVINEFFFNRYLSWSDLFKLVGGCFMENLGYRQLNSIWRLEALLVFFFKKHQWNSPERVGFQSKTKAL